MSVEKVLDVEGVMQRLEGDKELYRDIVQLFFEGFPATLEVLRDSASNNDAPTFGRTAHSTKGALGNLGAMRAWQKAYDLEQAGKSGDLTDAARLVVELEQEVAAFRGEYDIYIKSEAQ